ncbi:MAG TPA: response regulator [Gemmataceae bacterium]|jgi:DNA-binding response OmpR family regulator|nr:response regulator [Gemmataceae bacterium]
MDRPPTILVLDDDSNNLDSLRLYLSPKGYRVATARDANNGVQLAAELHPCLVITDLFLPGHSGFWVLEQLKNLPNPPPVIMLAGMGGMAQRAFAELLGVDEYLRKPVSMNRLFEVVSRLCPLSNVPLPKTAPALEAVGTHVAS